MRAGQGAGGGRGGGKGGRTLDGGNTEVYIRQGNHHAFALSLTHALQVGSAALLGAEEAAMTQSDVERALPGADRPLLDSLFIRAYGERFAAGAPDATTDGDAALALVRRLLALL